MKEWPKTYEGMWSWLTSTPPAGLGIAPDELLQKARNYQTWARSLGASYEDVFQDALLSLHTDWVEGKLTEIRTGSGELGKRSALGYFSTACLNTVRKVASKQTTVTKHASAVYYRMEAMSRDTATRQVLAKDLARVFPLARRILQESGHDDKLEIFELRVVLGLEHAAIAEKLGISSALSRKRIERCLEVLKSHWPTEESEDLA